jgi:hypothetical protein
MAYTKEGVKYFTNAMQGAPALTATAGSLIAVLDACFKDGFGLLAVSSIVVSGGVATMTITGGHQYKQWSVLQIAGVTGAMAALNAQWKNKAVTATTVVWDCPGVPDGTASGTITAKVAPLGWLKPFSGTNKAVYKSADPLSNGFLLRIDDTTTNLPKARGFTSMTDVDTGVAPFPSGYQAFWPKTFSGTAKNWAIIGDERFFILHTTAAANTLGFGGWAVYFGDLAPWCGGSDPFSTAIFAPTEDHNNDSTTWQPDISFNASGLSSGGAYTYFPKAIWGVGGVVQGSQVMMTASNGNLSGGNAVALSFPHPAGYGMSWHPVLAFQTNIVRGYVPGLYHTPYQTVAVYAAFQQYQLVTDLDDRMTGRVGMVLGTGYNSAPADCYMRTMVDIIGPWRT